MLDEEELIRRCRKRDEKAQRMLFDKYKGRIMGICLRYAGNPEDAQDILQETFIKIFKHLKKLKNAKALNPWMTRTAINTAINFINRRRLKDIAPEDYAGDEMILEPGILDELSNQELMRLINQLPEGYRLVFNMFVIDGFSHREIAGRLKISENTSKTQYFKARVFLKKNLINMGIKSYERDG